MKVKARTGKIWDQQFHSREDTTQIENNLEHMIEKLWAQNLALP